MQTYLDCIPCFLRQAIEGIRLVTQDKALHEQVLREILLEASRMDLSQPPPAMGQRVHQWIREKSGNHDPYREIKKRSNRRMMDLYPKVRDLAASSSDPLAAAIGFSIVGNMIDYAAFAGLKEEQIEKALEEATEVRLNGEALRQFRGALQRARNILFVGDNAGEIVFDRILVEFLPHKGIAYVVRGGPIINDVTLEDARDVGLDRLVEVIDSGSQAPGILPEQCSEAFRRRFLAADLVISKGQGNYEGLSGEAKEIFFLLKAKCAVIARDLGCEAGSMVFRGSS